MKRYVRIVTTKGQYDSEWEFAQEEELAQRAGLVEREGITLHRPSCDVYVPPQAIVAIIVYKKGYSPK